MKTIDDMIVKTEGVPPEKEAPRKPPNYRERYRSKGDQQMTHLNQMISNTVCRINSDPEAFREYLDIQSRFPGFTEKNTILIMAQNPDASYLASSETWGDKGFSVRRGEAGVQIFGPGVPNPDAEADTKTPASIRILYDIRQTTALPTPEPSMHYDQRFLLKAILRTSPCAVDCSDNIAPVRKASYNLQNDTIFIHPGMTPAQLYQTLAEQISMRIARDYGLQEPQRILVGDAISYLLCKKYGVDMSNYGIAVIPDWFSALGESQVIQELSNIRLIAQQMGKQMDETLKLGKEPHLQKRDASERGGG